MGLLGLLRLPMHWTWGGWELWGVGGTDPLAHRPTVVALNPAGPDVK